MCSAPPPLITRALPDLGEWAAHFLKAPIPVLADTAEVLQSLRENEDAVDAHLLAESIGTDPLMTLKLLAHVAKVRSARSTTDPETVTAALVLLLAAEVVAATAVVSEAALIYMARVRHVLVSLATITLQALLTVGGMLLVERYASREGHHLYLYPFAGRLVHLGLASLLAWRLARDRPNTFSLSFWILASSAARCCCCMALRERNRIAVTSPTSCRDRKSTRPNSSHSGESRMPSSA